MSDKKVTHDFIQHLREKAEKAKMNAAYSGAHHDGGYSFQMARIQFYLYGQSSIFPKEWEEDYKEFLVISEPEYQEYLRLKRKYER